MVDIPVGTYPYHKRHAIMEAVQAGLLPHTRFDGDKVHEGCVTVIVRVVPPNAKMVYYDEVGGPVDVEVWNKITGAKI